jgi:transcription initiation factor TFIIH subunit 1
MYPPATEQPFLAQATPAQKVAKAAKMVGYLGKTPEKVNALIQAAQAEGVDGSRVEIVRILLSLLCNFMIASHLRP